MKLPTKLVAVRKISSSKPRASFPMEEIERAAQLIINVEGTINPIILKRTSLESYEVVDGHFEYYAAVRAREMSPLKGEMIQAIILEPENEEDLRKQVDLFRRNSDSTVSLNEGFDNSVLVNLEKVFQTQFEELRKDIRNLNGVVNELSELREEAIGITVKRVLDKIDPKLDLNLADEKDLMTVPAIGPKLASEIVKLRETKGKFSSIEELAEVKKISKNVIKNNRWDKFLKV